VEDSILTTIKQMLGIDSGYDAFDSEIMAHINTALMIAAQFGVGRRYSITGTEETWGDYLQGNEAFLSGIITYVYEKVKLVFDPPTSSIAADAAKSMASELEFRMNVDYEEGVGSND
jgi:hypothetical protein